MIAAWILYALLVGILVGGGALVLENLLRAHKLPTRWVWTGAMALSLFWPLGHLLLKYWPRDVAPIPIPSPGRVVALEPLAVQVAPESFLRYMDGPILMVWVVSSVVLLLMFGILILRTRRLRRAWRGERAGGQTVLFSRDMGPAVVGYMEPQIVLPTWCRELEEQTLNLIIDHELEHLKAGDLRLILTTGILPILLPWHAPIWWQYKRLRLAVEGDCDLRVLKKHPDRTRPYMELLLQVGGTPPRTEALVAMLSEPEESLERRIRIMTMPIPRKPWTRGLFLTAIGGMLLAVACWAPSPTDIQQVEPEIQAVRIQPPAEQVTQAADPDGSQEEEGEPTFTPYTVQPDITNRAEVSAALEREYPPLLRDAGIGGSIQVWFYIDETGQVKRTQVKESSGHQALDQAAIMVASLIRFTPALNGEKRVPVWISLPIAFRSTEPASQASQDLATTEARIRIPPTPEELASYDPASGLPPPPELKQPDISKSPTFTPYTVQPDITNRFEVARALEGNYPPVLRDAGIGGTVQVWFFIDEAGKVQKAQVNQSSGHQALDDAGLVVARMIEFTPARNRDRRVSVWISLPITFTTR